MNTKHLAMSKFNSVGRKRFLEKYGPNQKVWNYTTVDQVEFEVKFPFITDNEDTLGKNSAGTVLNGTDQLDVRVGRRASVAIKNVVNFLLNPEQHTLAEPFKEAYLVLLGTLKLNLSSADKSHRKDYTFEDMVLILTHIPHVNKWEMGGRHCTKNKEKMYTIVCPGTNSDGQHLSLHFTKKSINQIILSHSHELDLSNWMGDLDSSTPGCKI